jgi:hypothetical protein
MENTDRTITHKTNKTDETHNSLRNALHNVPASTKSSENTDNTNSTRPRLSERTPTWTELEEQIKQLFQEQPLTSEASTTTTTPEASGNLPNPFEKLSIWKSPEGESLDKELGEESPEGKPLYQRKSNKKRPGTSKPE